MRSFVIVLVIIGTCYTARLDSIYLPPNAGNAGGVGLIQPPPSGLGAGGPIKLSRPVDFNSPSSHGGSDGFGFGSGGAYTNGAISSSAHEKEIPIISYNNENAGDGNYQYSYETGNGITVQERGHKQGESESVSGSFSYTGPDGVQYAITYTADEYGFHPQGAHLPTPPPIPPEIQRGVELALAAEARGENQDGRYSHGDSGYPSGASSHGSSAYQGPSSYQASSTGYQY